MLNYLLCSVKENHGQRAASEIQSTISEIIPKLPSLAAALPSSSECFVCNDRKSQSKRISPTQDLISKVARKLLVSCVEHIFF